MFQKQLMMRKVVYSLVPIFLFSMVLYGWRSLALAAVVFVSGILAEYIFTKPKGKKVSEAVLVTCSLYTLSMPPAVPLWIAAVGIVFGVIFAKNIYGGFGRNIFNPAIAGRLFIYVAFPDGMQRSFLQPWKPGMPWNFALGSSADAATAATPLMDMKEGITPPLMDLIRGFRIGALGESAVILILLAAVYLIYTKTASWKIIVSTMLSFCAVNTVLWAAGVVPAGSDIPFPPLESLFAGSFLYIAVFMVTDPVTAPKNSASQWIYGLLIGGISAAIRIFSLFPEGVSFGLLIGNTFASLLDEWFPAKKKAAAKPAGKAGTKPAAGAAKPAEGGAI
ncbi:MAG: NADH:ubiquinone oxidoreductase, Na translocating, B subunit [Spirochaeta sp. LUC14_002_19_P3]|nr:MAG: NADH:ubiquinone oxidoreductase, Na translocating, B subunit [Spirochaeta sp. LUC14_002_19_P3]